MLSVKYDSTIGKCVFTPSSSDSFNEMRKYVPPIHGFPQRAQVTFPNRYYRQLFDKVDFPSDRAFRELRLRNNLYFVV